jgi:hypothetical protein
MKDYWMVLYSVFFCTDLIRNPKLLPPQYTGLSIRGGTRYFYLPEMVFEEIIQCLNISSVSF